jgi:hypothetical protein
MGSLSMVDADKPAGFLAFKRDKNGIIIEIAVVPDKDKLKEWKSGTTTGSQASPDSPSTDVPSTEESSPPSQDIIKSLLGRFRKSMTSVHSMINFTSAIASGVGRYLFYQKLVEHAKSDLYLLEEDNNTSVYNIYNHNMQEIRRLLDEFALDKQGFDALPGATLLSLVATFDSYFSEVVKFFLAIHPERYTESAKPVTLKEVFAKKSLDEVINQVIDNEINQLMRGSHTDQVQFIELHLDVKITNHYERWPNFVEIFERRNLVAHGNLIVNETYILNCKSAKYRDIDKITVGEQLSLDSKYLHKATDVLSEFGILLVFVLWRKHIKDSGEDAFEYINQTSYELIRVKRPRVAQRLLDFALYKQRRDCSDFTARMMLMNLANSYKKQENDDKCNEVISSIDGTASGDNFQICIASLRGDVDKVVALMPGLAVRKGPRAGGISANSFRAWPIFDWVRDDPRVNETFEHVYGEPMRNKVADAVTGLKATETQESESATSDSSAVETTATRH